MFGNNDEIQASAETMPVPRGGVSLPVAEGGAEMALVRRNTEAPGLVAYERAQIDSQIATAKAYPRSIQQFLTNCIAAATADREIAESLFYSVPVGKENGRQKYVEGPSIRLAELVAAYYKNVRMESGIIEQTDKAVVAYAIAADFEANTARRFLHSESIVDKNGNRYSDRQIERIKDVAQSKALRKALFTVVPVALIKPIVKAAKNVINGGRTLQQRRDDLVKWIESLRIEQRRVWSALGVSGPADLTDEHITEMVGIYNAIRNKETSVDEAFPPVSRFVKEEKVNARARAREERKPGDFITQPQAEEQPEACPIPADPLEVVAGGGDIAAECTGRRSLEQEVKGNE